MQGSIFGKDYLTFSLSKLEALKAKHYVSHHGALWDTFYKSMFVVMKFMKDTVREYLESVNNYSMQLFQS